MPISNPPLAAVDFFTSRQSMIFDGVDEEVDMGNPSELQITGAMTIAAWIKTANGALQRFVSKRGGAGQRAYSLETQTGPNLHFVISSNGTVTFDSGASNNIDDLWHLVHGVYIPSTAVQIYVDGILENENTTSIPASQFNSTVNFKAPSSALDGLLDEVMVYNIGFSATQIREHANGRKPVDPKTLPTSGNLVGYWRYGEGDTISSILDNSVNSNNGTPANMEAEDIVGNAAP